MHEIVTEPKNGTVMSNVTPGASTVRVALAPDGVMLADEGAAETVNTVISKASASRLAFLALFMCHSSFRR